MKVLRFAAATVLLFAAGAAHATGVGVGVYGGLSYPVIQDDVKSGTLIGFRAPVSLVPMLTVEPFYASSSLGDAEETLGGIQYTREGFDQTAYGVSVMLGSPNGMGFKFYPFAGIGKYKLERTGTDIDEVGYNFGLGIGIGATPKISLQIRGELEMVKTGDTSRKFGNATAGLTYSLMP
ncbi:MAG TPA: outer membrane beta-barrel protein [Candidatus Eisenbacteria bacterium]|nr:outer membrane beta-barrel protein [Candidatus Eisenbacteria bacterium]